MRKSRILTASAGALGLLVAGLAAYAQETAPPAAPPATAPAAEPSSEQMITAIKKSLAQSQQNLKQYQWLETTVVSIGGEEKSNTQNQCSYGADGKVAKVPVSAAPADDSKQRGLKGKVVAQKKEELTGYAQSAVALIKTYLPPDPAKIQTAKDAGKVSVTVVEPGKLAKVDVKDYEKPGDDLGFQVDLATHQITGISVASYLTDAADAVTLDVQMAALEDGTQYAATTKLDGKSQNLAVVVTNSGYQKKAN